VEGLSEKEAIPTLLRANGVNWPQVASPVEIKDCGGKDSILSPFRLKLELKTSNLLALGVVLDADEDAKAEWGKIRSLLSSECDNMPLEIGPNGWIGRATNGVEIGIWIMPDNQSRGRLETFLLYLAKPGWLLELVKRCCKLAQKKGAQFSNEHFDEAVIHTWLAWQSNPGKTLAEALRDDVLDPKNAHCSSFVGWFRMLFKN
jgi:hypothetical protein